MRVKDRRRCLKGVDSRSKEAPEFIAIEAQPTDEVVQALRLGKAQRATHEPFDPGPHVDGLALDVLRVLLPHLRRRGIERPRIGPHPSVENFGMPKGSNSCWSLRKTSSFRRPHP